jgi:hypothetical protein
MAGAVLERELTAPKTGGVNYRVAEDADDAEIRRLLRDNPMPGRISLSLEREPNFFADAVSPSEIKKTIVARTGGELVCVGSCAIRERFVNGKPRMVGYLGSLRLDVRHAGRFDILRRGYNYFRQLEQEAPADFYFTSIAADNHRARAFLERGLPGMPRYEFICELVTLTIPTLLRTRTRPMNQNIACPGSPHELLAFLNQRNSAFQFAPLWSAEDLLALQQPSPSSSSTIRSMVPNASANQNAAFRELGLQSSNFCVLRSGQQIEACGALWDQRPFKQVVVRGYSTFLATARPLLNAFSRLTSQPPLPAIGETLPIAFASHLAANTNAALVDLIQHLSILAHHRGIELLTLGFNSNDPRLLSVRQHFRCRQYHSRLYLVHWPGIGRPARELDNRVLAPEIALL